MAGLQITIHKLGVVRERVLKDGTIEKSKPGKGTITVHGPGLGQYGVTLYVNQWELLLQAAHVAGILGKCAQGRAEGTVALPESKASGSEYEDLAAFGAKLLAAEKPKK